MKNRYLKNFPSPSPLSHILLYSDVLSLAQDVRFVTQKEWWWDHAAPLLPSEAEPPDPEHTDDKKTAYKALRGGRTHNLEMY
jgi:hypothetical protein